MSPRWDDMHRDILVAIKMEEEQDFGDKCIEINNKILQNFPKHSASDRRLGIAYFHTGEYNMAIYHLDRYLRSEEPSLIKNEIREMHARAVTTWDLMRTEIESGGADDPEQDDFVYAGNKGYL